MFLKPREYFPIARQLHDPLDSTTYYVQAVIRNENTNTVIETLNLTDEGNQLFVKRWQVPADVSGEGYWISIRTRVYTDSGYTSLSENHSQELGNYIVFERSRPLGGGSSGGSDVKVDYKRIQKMIDDALEAVLEKIPDAPETPKPVNLEPLMTVLGDIKTSLLLIPTEHPEALKLDPILDSITLSEKHLSDAIQKVIDIPKPNLDPIISLLQDLSKKLEGAKGLEKYIEIAPQFKQNIDSALAGLQSIDQSMKEYVFIMEKKGAKEGVSKKKEPQSYDELFKVT